MENGPKSKKPKFEDNIFKAQFLENWMNEELKTNPKSLNPKNSKCKIAPCFYFRGL